MIYAKMDIELGDEITYGKLRSVSSFALANVVVSQIITFLSSKTRYLVSVVQLSVVAILTRLLSYNRPLSVHFHTLLAFVALHITYVFFNWFLLRIAVHCSIMISEYSQESFIGMVT